MTLEIHMFAQLRNSFLAELKTTKQKTMYANVTEGFFVKKKIDIKLLTLQSQKVQKISTILQSKTYILFMLLTIKTKIKKGS